MKIPVFLLFTLLGCGSSPKVELTTNKLPDYPLPAELKSTLDQKVQKKLVACYEEKLLDNKDLGGVVEIEAYGSHGILAVESVNDAPAPLVDCVKSTFADQKIMRVLVDGDNYAGFMLKANFSK